MIITDKIELIVSTSQELGLLMQHRGICFEYEGTKYILHQTFSGPETIPAERFFGTRTLLFRKTYLLKKELDTDEIMQWKRYQTFNLINRNCENFVNEIIDTYTTCRHARVSQQVVFWTVSLVLAIINMQTENNRL